MPTFEQRRVLIVVRTYPTPAQKGVEVSCTAAITEDQKWMRLFPVPYRFLTHERRFRKYQWIEVDVTKASDPRPESYKIRGESIRVLTEPLGTDKAWELRKQYTLPLKSHCLCCLRRERDEKGFPTLGIFKPKNIEALIIEADSPVWSDGQLAILRQGDLFEQSPQNELEKVPYCFKYRFRCDHETCKGHTLSCTDWEMGESWRKWKDEYGADWESKFRQRYEREMIGEKDTHFYVGTVHKHPGAWIIIGLFYPPKAAQLGMLY